MGKLNSIRTIKNLHSQDLILVRTGKFIHVYGKDAVIIAYMFDYQIKKVDNINMCGFPDTILNKVISIIEDKKINYKVIDKPDQFNIETEEKYPVNNYETIYTVANQYVVRKKRIMAIKEYLMENINNNEINSKIENIEKIIYI